MLWGRLLRTAACIDLVRIREGGETLNAPAVICLIFIATLLPATATASPPAAATLAPKTWRVGNTPIDVGRCPSGFCLIASSCLTEAGQFCRALQVMNNRVQSDSGPGGTNPGSGVCRERLRGKIFVARDDAGNEEAFCLFEDGSFLSLDGLWRW
jgi:hypothetical protein